MAKCAGEGGQPSEDEIGSGPANRPLELLGPQQRRYMHERCKGVGYELDRSVNPALEQRWAHRRQMIAPHVLRNTHSDVADRFRNGDHGGAPVANLKENLLNGILHPHDVPSLVAARCKGASWVVFGSRRLKLTTRQLLRARRYCYWMLLVILPPS